MGSKIGIIFAFLLSIAAAGGSYYLYQGGVEERLRREALEAKYDQVKEKIIVVQAEKEQTASEKERYKAESEEYRARAQAMQKQMEQLQTEQSKSQELQAQLQKEIASNQETVAELQKKVEELDRKAREAQQACVTRPEDFSTAQSFSPLVSVPGSTPAPAASKLTFTPVTSGPMTSSTGTAAASPAPVTSSSPVVTSVPAAALADLKGPKVLTVNRKFNFVVVNLGLQDGLKMGDQLAVVKEGKDNATLQVEKLYDRFSAATIVTENSQQPVAEGDEIRRS